MRWVIACVMLLRVAMVDAAPKTDVRVDRRVELVSVVCALAQYKEYMLGAANPYRTEAIKAFAPFIKHPVVAAMAKLHAEKDISFDAPMNLAVHLDDKLRVVNKTELVALEPRWKDVDVDALAAELRDFATTSKFDAFFTSHRAHYDKVEGILQAAVDAEQPIAWFDATFGTRKGAAYTVVPSFMTGSWNFGVRAMEGKALHMFQLIGVDTKDALPKVDEQLVYLLVHEMAHSYVNPYLADHAKELAVPAAALFAKVADQMKANHYSTWQIFLNEAVVRATVVLYLHDKKGEAAAKAAQDDEVKRGFLWTAQLVELMRAYQKDHQPYAARLATLLAGLK